MGGENFKAQVDAPWTVAANPLAWTLWGVDLTMWLAGAPGRMGTATPDFKHESVLVEGTTATRRRVGFTSKLEETPFEGLSTGYDLIKRSYITYPTSKCFGTRTYLGEHTPAGAKVPLKLFGETTWMTYKEVGDMATSFGAGLRQLGMTPLKPGADFEAVSGPSTIMIFEDTSKQWTMCAHGAMSQSICVATSYATLGADALVDAMLESEATVIFTNQKKVKEVLALASRCPKLTTIIYSDHMTTSADAIDVTGSKLKVVSFDEVVLMGMSSPIPATHPTPECMALLMYTSGSTGKPKGVMLKHSALTAAVAAAYHHLGPSMLSKGNEPHQEECYLAYLPAAHILECTAQLAFFCFGHTIGFACPKTISSKGACRQLKDGSINTTPGYPNPPGGIQEFRPTIMAAVPKIWDILKKGVEDVVGKSSPAVKFLFQTAYSGRASAIASGRESPLLKKIFKKTKAMMGGRLRIGISGGGPISSEVQTFIRTVFGCNLIQGYALTETCSVGTIQPLEDTRNGIVGVPLSAIEIKLAPCESVLDREGKPYLDTDKMHLGEKCAGRGEVMLRGKACAVGYFKQQDKTDEAFEKDGWFHSGDIGVWTPDGSLKLVDRLKNLVKLKGGEYIALESMEASYSTSPYVASLNGGVLCYGTGEMDRPVALIQADMHKIKEFAEKAGIDTTNAEALVTNKDVVAEVMKTMLAAHKNGKLGATEKLCAFHLIPGTGSMTDLTLTSPWTPDNGGLTASNKLQRKPVEAAFETLLAPLVKKAIF
mmetsp:Transcript_19577/g.32893  ORF Transcript_19577/g.32893 Transcript_19577/m.32893 type:complete len:768 (+) Transcript_19577:99-2402(+)|eukprot:CAMPEP_0198201162 /NCGR_PEP_ID=MMETSP1445-20131203/3939_1 /TAXON_ID=36898 /ORGANISM="Pyramimonas sp., Strain CCMP2087" /LENGTH=767 /DNA_ID=CAMNT_0043871361 /DNA_START=80 /DNA_END=2383 /DNA_ORIENTATION=+